MTCPDCEQMEASLEIAKEELQQAKAAIASLKYLQKYEGTQKVESDHLGDTARIIMLEAEVKRLHQELERARG